MRRGPTAVLLLVLGCSGQPEQPAGDGGTPVDCPNDLPQDCPTAPSYQSDIAPLLQQHCVVCHSPTGLESERPLNSYGAVYGQRSEVLTQVYGCQMPPPDMPPLSRADRQLLLRWLVCHAPNN